MESTASEKTFWCGWDVPHDIPQDELPASWPPGITAWRTGGTDRYSTYAGAVVAADGEAAMALVKFVYGQQAGRIATRWRPHERAPITSDRFPGL